MTENCSCRGIAARLRSRPNRTCPKCTVLPNLNDVTLDFVNSNSEHFYQNTPSLPSEERSVVIAGLENILVELEIAPSPSEEENFFSPPLRTHLQEIAPIQELIGGISLGRPHPIYEVPREPLIEDLRANFDMERAIDEFRDFQSSNQRAPGTFSGKPTEDVRKFFRHVDRYAVFNNWRQAKQLEYIPLLLTGSAIELYESLPLATRQDLDALREAMYNHFDPQDLKIIGWATLQHRSQRVGESVNAYFDDLRRMAVKLELGNDQLLLHFLQGLPGATRRYVSLQRPQTAQEALTLARDFHAFDAITAAEPANVLMDAERNNKMGKNTVTVATAVVNTQKDEIEDIKRQLRIMQGSLRELSTANENTNIPADPQREAQRYNDSSFYRNNTYNQKPSSHNFPSEQGNLSNQNFRGRNENLSDNQSFNNRFYGDNSSSNFGTYNGGSSNNRTYRSDRSHLSPGMRTHEW